MWVGGAPEPRSSQGSAHRRLANLQQSRGTAEATTHRQKRRGPSRWKGKQNKRQQRGGPHETPNGCLFFFANPDAVIFHVLDSGFTGRPSLEELVHHATQH